MFISKNIQKLLCGAVLCLLTLSLTPAKALYWPDEGAMDDDFEDYLIQELGGQEVWVDLAQDFWVTTTDAYDGTKSAHGQTEGGNPQRAKHPSEEEQGTGWIDFYINIAPQSACSGGASDKNGIILGEADYDTPVVYVQFICQADNLLDLQVLTSTTTTTLFTNLATSTWHHVIIHYNSDYTTYGWQRVKINDEDWSAWYQSYDKWVTVYYIHWFAWRNSWIDTIGQYGCGPTTCSFCTWWDTCMEQGTCRWDWDNEVCYPVSDLFPLWCAEGVCEFCDNESDCNAEADCYWRDNECFSGTAPIFTDWNTYYASNSDYATQTNWVATIVSNTSTTFATLGSWLTTFDDLFDTTLAGKRGEEFGQAIPRIRGYLAQVNQFFGGLPISYGFLFYLLIVFAIGIFRIVKGFVGIIRG